MIKVYQMDVMKALKQMPDESVDMQITSPPYWGLRDYGEGTEVIWDGDKNCGHEWKIIKHPPKGGKTKEDNMPKVGSNLKEQTDGISVRFGYETNICQKCGAWKGQLGLEPDFNLYIKHLADIFDEVKRVLKKDGTCWVNLGDTYGGSGCGKGDKRNNNRRPSQPMHYKDKPNPQRLLPTKSLVMIPFRFVIEMVNRGWILRNTIIWYKPNCMPSSVKDRFTVDFEYLFFFSKKKKYYFETQYEPLLHKKEFKTLERQNRLISKLYKIKQDIRDEKISYKGKSRDLSQYNNALANAKAYRTALKILEEEEKLSKQEIKYLKDYVQNHFSSPKGRNKRAVWSICPKPYKEAHFAVFPEKLVEIPIKTTRKNAVILDIFAGSGTTLKVARDLHRDSIGIEIKKEYCDLIKKRLFLGNQPLINDFEIIK